jgi:hypothetical protein
MNATAQMRRQKRFATRPGTADLLAKQRAAEEIQWLSITSSVRLWNLGILQQHRIRRDRGW